MTDKPNDGCNPETLSEHLAFREKMAQASRDCIRRNEEEMQRERDSELSSLLAEIDRLKALVKRRDMQLNRAVNIAAIMKREVGELRQLVHLGYNDGWQSGLMEKVPDSILDGEYDEMELDWKRSQTKKILDDTNKRLDELTPPKTD